MKKKILFIIFILSFGILFSGCTNTNEKIKYAKENELIKLFLQYYPEAGYEFNAEGDQITFKVNKGDRSLYIQVAAQDGISVDEVLYCMKMNEDLNDIIFLEENKEGMTKRLENNSCFE